MSALPPTWIEMNDGLVLYRFLKSCSDLGNACCSMRYSKVSYLVALEITVCIAVDNLHWLK